MEIQNLSNQSNINFAMPLDLKSYFTNIQSAMNSVEPSRVGEFIKLLKNLSVQNSIFLIGNGGSASIASHFAVDLERSFRLIGNKSKIISLSDSASSISAISNDFGFDESYSSIIQRQAFEGDLLIVISSSGKSTNLIHAVSAAKERGIYSIGILGFDGGLLLDVVDLAILVKTDLGAYPLAEDIHSSVCHFVSWSLRGEVNFKK